MGIIASKDLNFSASPLTPELKSGVSMEQVPISETSTNAGLDDIFNMYSRARSGLTAFSYVPADLTYVKFTATSIIVSLDFWVWPTPISLAYSLKLSNGSISSKSAVEEPKSGNIVMPMATHVQLPYSTDPDQSEAEWESPCYNSEGHLIVPPEIFFKGPYLYTEIETFGIIRADLKAQGYLHTATISFPKSQTGRTEIAGVVDNQTISNSITNVKCLVICSYMDEKGKLQEESLELKIPKVVLDLLAECDDGKVKSDPRCEEDTQGDTVPGEHIIYYYSTCTGEILDIVRSDATESTSAGCDS